MAEAAVWLKLHITLTCQLFVVCKEREGPLATVCGTKRKCLCKQQTLKEPKLAQLDNVLYAQFAVV